MKKIIILSIFCLLATANSLFAANSMGYTINQQAYCECNGSVTITGYMGICAFKTGATYLEVEEWDDVNNIWINNQILDQTNYDPTVSTVSLSKTFNNLCPGKIRARFMFNQAGTQYFMSMVDGDYYGWLEIVIEGPDEFLDASVTSTNGTCYGSGTADITVTGGNGGNSIVWKKNGQAFPAGNGKTSMDNLADGTYTVTITDSEGCVIVKTFTIDNTYAPIDYSLEITNSGCNGSNTGEIKICGLTPNIDYYVSKATSLYDSPIDYVIIDDCYVFSGVNASDRTITVIHIPSGCPITIQATVIEYPELLVIPIVKQSGCDGGMNSGKIELDITSGTAPYSYDWSHNSSLSTNIAENLSPGTYTVTVTDANGCEKTLVIVIAQVPELKLSINVSDDNSGEDCCSVAIALASGGTAPYTYKWDDNSTGEFNTKCTFPATHTVTVTDAMGCTYTEQVTNTSCGGGGGPGGLEQQDVYPNPNFGVFDVEALTAAGEIIFELYDGTVKVKTKNNGILSAGTHTINWNTGLSAGMYTLVIWTDGVIEHEGVLVQIQ